MSKRTTMSPQQRRRDLIKAVRSYARAMVFYVVLSLVFAAMITLKTIIVYDEPGIDTVLL